MSTEEYKCWECGNDIPHSTMTKDSNGNWVHLQCQKPEASVKEYPIDPQTSRMIEDTFTYHPPRPDQIPRYTALRTQFRETALMVARFTPPGRERAVALTQLQLAVMLANAAIACGEK